MSEEQWFEQVSISAGLTPFYWRHPAFERMGNQFVVRFGPLWFGWSWIEMQSPTPREKP